MSDAQFKHEQLMRKRTVLVSKITDAVDAGEDTEQFKKQAEEADLDIERIIRSHKDARIASKHTQVTIGCAEVRKASVPNNSAS